MVDPRMKRFPSLLFRFSFIFQVYFGTYQDVREGEHQR